MLKRILSGAIVFGLGTTLAFAHAHLASSVPAASATVAQAPTRVQLNFSEAVSTKVSVVKVYPLPSTGNVSAAADQLVKGHLSSKQDTADRADEGLESVSSQSQTVSVKLKPGFKAGQYVVMWRVMAADDGHVTQGSYIFTYHPTH